MDLGLNGRVAIVCGASRGLGFACAKALADEGVSVVLVARTEAPAREAAQRIQVMTGSDVTVVLADVATSQGRADVLTACPDPDILVTNAGGPPTGDFRDWQRDDWIKAIDQNMLAPIELMRATVDGMMARRFGRIVNITSSAVKAPIASLGLSNGARSGLTGFVAGLARTTVRHNVTINNLLPGPFETDRLRSAFESIAQQSSRSAQDVEQQWRKRNPAQRFGDPVEFGQACAFLCSANAGFLNGQNILLDGGEYPGTL
ncbi:SDR family oxidoreductase [soil metagenome]